MEWNVALFVKTVNIHKFDLQIYLMEMLCQEKNSNKITK